MHQEMHQEKEELHQESSYANLDEKQKAILDFCVEPRSAQEILENFGLYNQSRTRKRYIADLVEKGLLVMTIPNNPTDRNQKYQRKQLAENQDPQT
jgi:ATP-dependent DNA helicase RecG